ncbi:hypothetical protein KAX29_04370 [candidate division WOR-3 bacterium]|nr:hypothetical protein [candidate division WOR-3 bacterium]
MIRQERLKELAPIVEKAVIEAFELARKNEKNPNDFVLFLENSYKLNHSNEGWSPYSLGPGLDWICDKDRRKFFVDMIRLPFEVQYNALKNEEKKEKIRKFSIHLELMVYTHAWESIPNLRDLKHLANFIESKPYDWELEVSTYKDQKSKQDFIRKDIRNIFQKMDLKIANVMTSSYHSQLRNAFAHSQYAFFQDRIRLGNYSQEDWQMESISFDEWEDRFMWTVLLFDMILRKKQEYKKTIAEENDYIEVWEPNDKGGYKKSILVYDEVSNRFIWK